MGEDSEKRGRRRGMINLDTWRAKITAIGAVAGSLAATWFLVAGVFSFTCNKANAYVDGRVEPIVMEKIEPVYRMAAETRYIQAEMADTLIVRRAMRRMKEDSVKLAQGLIRR